MGIEVWMQAKSRMGARVRVNVRVRVRLRVGVRMRLGVDGNGLGQGSDYDEFRAT